MNPYFKICAALLLTAAVAGCPGWRGQRPLPEGVWCVSKANVSCREDGQTWRTAFRTIQPAIDAAAQAGGGEVWVAQGVYDEEREREVVLRSYDYPREDVAFDVGSLQLRTAVGVYGGFEGVETRLSDRDWEDHATVIDGSHSRKGAAACHVVMGTDGAVLDGCTVTGGRAEFPAGGIYGSPEQLVEAGAGLYASDVAALTIRNCRFTDNQALGGLFGSGGGAFVRTRDDATVGSAFEHCLFEGNTARHAGALEAWPNVTVVDCEFTANEALGTEIAIGGAILVVGTVSDCRFERNKALSGGALWAAGVVRNCLFLDNEATQGAGAARGGSRLSIESCAFIGNRVTGAGGVGGAVLPGPTLHVRNSVFWGNEAEAGGALYARGAASVLGQYLPEIVLQQCTFYANGDAAALDVEAAGLLGQNLVVWGQPQAPAVRLVDGLGGSIAVTHSDVQRGYPGTGNLDVDPGFVDPAAGDFRLRADSPLVDAGDGAPARFPYFWQTQDPYPVPAQDLDGQPRPCGPAPDPGAYERCAP